MRWIRKWDGNLNKVSTSAGARSSVSRRNRDHMGGNTWWSNRQCDDDIIGKLIEGEEEGACTIFLRLCKLLFSYVFLNFTIMQNIAEYRGAYHNIPSQAVWRTQSLLPQVCHQRSHPLRERRPITGDSLERFNSNTSGESDSCKMFFWWRRGLIS